jgi:hypothetical protein
LLEFLGLNDLFVGRGFQPRGATLKGSHYDRTKENLVMQFTVGAGFKAAPTNEKHN